MADGAEPMKGGGAALGGRGTGTGPPIPDAIPFDGVPELDLRDERAAETSHEAFISDHRQDLLMFPLLGRLLKWRGLQPTLEVPGVILFLLVVVVGIWGTQEPSQNLATMLVWVYWWSLVIFSFIFVGRIWCMVCPLGAVGEWVHRRIGTLGRRLPKGLQNLWPAHIFFISLTGLDMVYGIDTLPWFTGAFVLALILLAVLFGVIYERRTFCRYICPIGGMCGIYSMTSVVELRVKSRARCDSCTTKECIKGTDGSYACPWFEYPGAMDRNNYCTMCLECVRSCPHENIGLMVRPPGQDLWRTNIRVFDEVILAVSLIGVMASHTIATTQAFVDWTDGVVVSYGIPLWLILTLVYIFSIVGANLAYLGASALAARLTSTPDRPLNGRTVYKWTGYALIPLALSMHLARNVPFLSIWGTSLIEVMRNIARDFPLGAGPILTQDLLPADSQRLVKILIIFFGFIFSAYAAYRLSLRMQPQRRKAGRLMAAILLVMTLFSVVFVYILSLPILA